MREVIMLKGLPASGKTTHAKELASGRGFVRVNKDDLRAMLHGGKHTKGNEAQVLAVRDAIIIDSLKRDRDVVVDDTNFNPIHEIALRNLALEHGAQFSVDDRFLGVPPDVCIERDLKRVNSVGPKVIWQMHNEYLKPAAAVYEPPEGMPKAIICDIDGTLAHLTDRGPYDWKLVGQDTLDTAVAGILRAYKNGHIVLLSGREDSCRAETKEWLIRHNIKYDHLYMRAEGDHRKDSIIKRELFDKHIRNDYQVDFILDDRDQVVDMWRNELGLKVFQVAEGDF